MRKKRLSALIAVLIAVFSGCTNSDTNAGNVTSVNTTAALTVVTTTVSSAEAETTASATTAASSSESTVNNTVTEADSVLPVRTVDINGITYELEYDESDNTWSTQKEELKILADIMKAECAISPAIKGTYLLATDDDIIFIGGINSVDINGNKVDEYTTYEIGSLTKMITATAVLQLYEQGKLSLNDTLDKYFPEYVSKFGEDISIYHLLHMQSGLQQEFLTQFFRNSSGKQDREVTNKFYTDGYTDDELLSALFSGHLLYEPGTGCSYSNAGYTLLAMIIESITGESYAEYIQKNIFDVCGMEHSTSMTSADLTSIPDALSDDSHKLNYENTLDNGYMRSPRTTRGAMDIHSCAADLLSFNRALNGGKLLSESSLEIMFHADKEYCCGWMPNPEGDDIFYFTGSTLSYISDIEYMKSEKYGNVYLIQLHPTYNGSGYIFECDKSIIDAVYQ